MSAKIQIKSDLVGTFGGIFLLFDHFGKADLDKLINKSLGYRRFNTKYSYSDIFKTLLATYAANGLCMEDSKRVSNQISENSQGEAKHWWSLAIAKSSLPIGKQK